MNSSFGRSMAFAALLGAPLAGFGEVFPAPAGATAAPPAESPNPEVRAAQDKLQLATEKLKKLMAEREQALQRQRELDASRASRQAAAGEKIKQLSAELEFLRSQDKALDEELQRRKTAPASTTPVPADTLRFDLKVSPPDCQSQKGEIRFVPDQKL